MSDPVLTLAEPPAESAPSLETVQTLAQWRNSWAQSRTRFGAWVDALVATHLAHGGRVAVLLANGLEAVR